MIQFMESFRVIENVQLSEGTFRLRTERPDTTIRAGQCFSVGTKDLGINREYSMYSGANDPYIDFLIREVPDGIVTPVLAQLNVGQLVEIGGPYGDFCVDKHDLLKDEFIFIASGTGIAPFHSYVKTFPDLKYNVFHGIRKETECYDQQSYRNGGYFPAISQPTTQESGQYVTKLLEDIELNPLAIYYLCGNRMMITNTVKLLLSRGVPGGQILMETFF
jgi:ferredoxin--NADP+ reductase